MILYLKHVATVGRCFDPLDDLPENMHIICVAGGFVGDPILPGVEWQSENAPLHLHAGENELSHHGDQLQTVCAAGGRRGADLSAQQHAGGGEFAEIHKRAATLTRWLLAEKTTEDNFSAHRGQVKTMHT